MSKESVFQSIEQRSAVDAVREQLVALIREGKLAPHEQLPSEKELCDTFGVSRPTLREAIHLLVGEGLVDVRRGQGTFIRQPSSSAAIQADVLSLLLPKDLQEIQDARRLIEPEIAARAASRASDNDLDALDVLLDRMEEIARSGESIFETAWDFHLQLAAAAGNAAIAKIVGILYEAIRVAERPLYDRHFDPLQDIQEHRQLLVSIRQRSPDNARQAMIRHLGDVEQGLDRALRREKRADRGRD
jgi:GntR family transcriptional repressor for pyruvate dehydrogenase complex